MKSKVKIAEMNPSSTGKSIIVQLRQTITQKVELSGDWLDGAPVIDDTRERVAYVRLSLQKKDDYNVGDELDGNIIVVERVGQAFFDGQEPKKRPIDGADESEWPTLTSNGQPIYRKSKFDPSGTLEDTLVKHDGETFITDDEEVLDGISESLS